MLTLTILFFIAGSFASFSEYPSNISSIIGSTVTIRCASFKSAEPIIYSQWKSNTGSLLGYHQEGILPGHQSRYSYLKPNPEEIHLKIDHVNLDDDGEYECQMLHPKNGPIRAKSILNVIVPPQSIYFMNYKQGSVVSVKEETTLNLTCVVPNVKPEPEVLWYFDDHIISKNIRKTLTQHVNKTSTVFTSLLINIKRSDNKKTIKCEVFMKENNTKLLSSTTLDVLYPSSDPILEIIEKTSPVKIGENVSISCSVLGGNPIPEVYWYLKNKKLSTHGVYKLETNEIRNIYSFIAERSDNRAEFECRVNNSHDKYLKNTLTVDVNYPPEDVELFGDSHVRYGSISHFQCITKTSNPAAEIVWSVDGKPMHTSTQSEQATSNGFISHSNLTLYSTNLSPNEQKLAVECSAKNLEGIASKQHVVKIISPPKSLEIHGFDEKNYFVGDIVNLTCIAEGGHPLADLTWFRANEKINNARSKIHGKLSLSSLSLRLERSDDHRWLRCEAVNTALDDPLIESRQMFVKYPPRSLVITPVSSGYQFVSGKPARLICKSTSSNPAAQLSWKFFQVDEKNIFGDISLNETTEQNGFNVDNVLSFVPSEDHDGSLVQCVASDPSWRNSVNTTFPLNVLYPPKLLINNPITITLSEEDSFKENLTVKSNPPVASWQWKKNGQFFDHTIGNVLARGAVLFGKQIKITDAGTYTVTATNSVGSSNLTIELVVEYSSKITKISPPVVAASDDSVFLECEARGEPFNVTMIKWYRNGRLLSSSYRNGNTAIVQLNATKHTSGEYVCVADNNVGKPTEKKTFLLVKAAPTIIFDSRYAKSAGMLGEDTVLKCRANAVPLAEFNWKVNEQLIKSNSSKYIFVVEQIDYSTFESKLWIKNLVPDDYKNKFECISKNMLGVDSLVISVIPETNPDQPSNFTMINSTENTISLAWVPQFDGGSEQTYEIRYRLEGQNRHSSVNTSYVNLRLSGLSKAQSYYFEIRSINAKGFASSWSKPSLFSTLGENGLALINSKKINEWLTTIVAIIIVAIVVFFLIHAIICCFLCNRKKRKLREKTEKVRLASGEVRRVQMYGALTTNEKVVHSTFGEFPEISEDENSVKTMIEVSPNGYMQPLDHLVYEDSSSLEYNFRSRVCRNNYCSPNHSTYANIPYPEPPNFNQLPTQQTYNNPMVSHNTFSTFIRHTPEENTGPISFGQLDGDLV